MSERFGYTLEEIKQLLALRDHRGNAAQVRALATAKIESINGRIESLDVAEFITYERLCCPFFNFEMAVEGENLSLRLKGKEGVKEFIKMEFGI
ncbi:MAG: MerR family DNA-binding protein [Acidobacteriota bacterium]|nr:MerR family DNA-binding protein [Acidobacteriota bacterium]